MTSYQLTDEDREVMKSILRAYKADGVDTPLLPMDVDIDGDGIVDAYGLDADGELIVVSGVDLGDTVYLATSESDESVEIYEGD